MKLTLLLRAAGHDYQNLPPPSRIRLKIPLVKLEMRNSILPMHSLLRINVLAAMKRDQGTLIFFVIIIITG